MSAADIARLAGVSRAAVSQWVREASFPPPLDVTAVRARYDRSKVERWLHSNSKLDSETTGNEAEPVDPTGRLWTFLADWRQQGVHVTPELIADALKSEPNLTADEVYAWLLRQRVFFAERSVPLAVLRRVVEAAPPAPGMSVYDPFAGYGGVALAAWETCPSIERFTGDEPYAGATLLANEIVGRIDTNATIHTCDVIYERPSTTKYDRIYSIPPFGQRIELDPTDIRWRYGAPPKSDAAWGWVQHCLHSLSDKGVAVVGLPMGPLFRSSSERIREQVVRDGVLRAVVAVGERLDYASIPLVLLVMSRVRGDTVAFIDLQDRPDATLPDLADPGADVGAVGRRVKFEELATENFDLTPARYLTAPVEVASLPERVGRASELHELVTRRLGELPSQIDPPVDDLLGGPSVEAPRLTLDQVCTIVSGQLAKTNKNGTGIAVVAPSDLLVSTEPHRWTTDPVKQKFGVINEGDLLVSLFAPFRATRAWGWMAGAIPGREIARLSIGDTEMLQASWLEAFFMSETFSLQMRRYAKGGSLPRVAMKDFRRIEIPLPPIAIQQDMNAALARTIGTREAARRLLANLDEYVSELTNLVYLSDDGRHGDD